MTGVLLSPGVSGTEPLTVNPARRLVVVVKRPAAGGSGAGGTASRSALASTPR